MYMEELSNINCLYIKQFGISVPVRTVGQFNFRQNDFLSFFTPFCSYNYLIINHLQYSIIYI
jgi:hypothetical protein